MQRTLFDEEHDLFRSSWRKFVEKEILPNNDTWEKDGLVARELFLAAGAHGFLGMAAPEQYGGGGVQDFRYNLIISEELLRVGMGGTGLGITLHNDICLPYFMDLTNDEQKQRWIPGICSGEKITAVAMTEPTIGSDLASMKTHAIKDGETYRINGAKTFITNGINADLIITAVKTDPSQKHKGMSLFVVESDMPGFNRGRNLEKIGLHAQDTAELFFDNVEVPIENLLGNVGEGFNQLMRNLPQERLSIAMGAIAGARAALTWTIEYTKEREAFGKPISSFQNSRFWFAEMETEITIGQIFIDQCVLAHNKGELTAVEAAEAKWWTTELQKKVVDTCLQLHGGYGYMLEYPISHAYLDSRIQTIYGGTTEIMKEIISKSMGL